MTTTTSEWTDETEALYQKLKSLPNQPAVKIAVRKILNEMDGEEMMTKLKSYIMSLNLDPKVLALLDRIYDTIYWKDEWCSEFSFKLTPRIRIDTFKPAGGLGGHYTYTFVIDGKKYSNDKKDFHWMDYYSKMLLPILELDSSLEKDLVKFLSSLTGGFVDDE